MNYLIVFIGGGLGAAARHGVNLLAARFLGTGFPYGTLAVNVTGSLAMGLIAGYAAHRGGLSGRWQLFLATGVLGGYTTFSAFSLDVVLLWQRQEIVAALTYVVASVGLSVLGLFAGLLLLRQLG